MGDVRGGRAGLHKPQFLLLLGDHVSEQENSLKRATVRPETGSRADDSLKHTGQDSWLLSHLRRNWNGMLPEVKSNLREQETFPKTLLGIRNIASSLLPTFSPIRTTVRLALQQHCIVSFEAFKHCPLLPVLPTPFWAPTASNPVANTPLYRTASS